MRPSCTNLEPRIFSQFLPRFENPHAAAVVPVSCISCSYIRACMLVPCKPALGAASCAGCCQKQRVSVWRRDDVVFWLLGSGGAGRRRAMPKGPEMAHKVTAEAVLLQMSSGAVVRCLGHAVSSRGCYLLSWTRQGTFLNQPTGTDRVQSQRRRRQVTNRLGLRCSNSEQPRAPANRTWSNVASQAQQTRILLSNVDEPSIGTSHDHVKSEIIVRPSISLNKASSS